MIGEAACRTIKLDAAAVHHSCPKDQEAECQHGRANVADVEVEQDLANPRRVAGLMASCQGPERVPDADIEGRRHPTDQGNNKEEISLGPATALWHPRNRAPSDLWQGERGRDQRRYRQHNNDNLDQAIEKPKRARPVDRRSQHSEHNRVTEHAKAVAEERLGEARGDDNNRCLDREHRPERDKAIERKRPTSLLTVGLEQAGARRRGITRSEGERRVLENIGEHDQSDERKPIRRARPGRLHEMRNTNSSPREEQPRSQGLPELALNRRHARRRP